jgi:tRNA dimethylallyltransferase
MQIYRGMDIGTAKPSKTEMGGVRHHMIDIIDPSQSYSAGQYVEAVAAIIDDLHRRGKIPVVAGGTGLYIKSMTRGIFGGPSADLELRANLLERERQRKGYLHDLLLSLDPETAGKIQRNDVRRAVRAVEVCLKSRQKLSVLQERLTRPLPYEFVKIGLTRDRKELYGMIDERVDAMIKAGLEDEVRRLLEMNPDRTAMQAIGYREFASFFAGEIDREEAVRLLKRNSRRYAKRQYTWFRKEEGVFWLDLTGIRSSFEVFHRLTDYILGTHPEIFGGDSGLCGDV